MGRSVVLDTETTGRSAQHNRIIEIGAVELVDRVYTEKKFHVYINPEQEVEQGAFSVHGLSNEFLADKPLFRDIVSEFMSFIEGAELIIHNAPFDVGFIEAELRRLNYSHQVLDGFCKILDTLPLARKKHPGQRNSLDALCKRYDVDNSGRSFHGALLDSYLLADVYLRMTGGQNSLFQNRKADLAQSNSQQSHPVVKVTKSDANRTSPKITLSAEHLARHEEYLAHITS
ncbi:MAG: DNA polymerase III subunit epsilon [Pseudomonadota bacterium]|nr:DNA polymerase III subunit epsilon [Pseudomonadota bacterium]